MKTNVLLDTSFILEGLDKLFDLYDDNCNLFVTDIVLQELDGKKSDEKVGFNARSFFRGMGSAKGRKLDRVPETMKPLCENDTLYMMTFSIASRKIPIYTLVRKRYKTRDINDSKIIEIAKDYGFKLVTFDMAQKVRAMSEGVHAMLGGEIKKDEVDAQGAVASMLRKEKEGYLTKGKSGRSGKIGGFLILLAIISLIAYPSGATILLAVFLFFIGIADLAGAENVKKTNQSREKSGGKSTWESNPVHDEVNGVMDYGYGLYD